MFRSAASLIAKKTAIVAITGVTVIGGATFALAVEGDPAPEEATQEVLTADDCTTDEVWNETDGTCDPKPPVTADDCTTDQIWNETDGTCDPKPPVTADDCTTDQIWNETDGTCDAVVTEDPDADLEEPAGEHPENHGKYVSEAAKACKTDMGEAKNHGQCVREVAQSDDGKKAADASEELDETETGAETSDEDNTSDLTETQTVDEPKAEKAPKGNGNAGGNGKGKKA